MQIDELVDRIETSVLGPSGFRSGDRERLVATLERFSVYLRHGQQLDSLDQTTLDALQAYPFDLDANDDHNLRLAFQALGRRDLLDHLAMVSADKYFRNKKLSVALKEMADLKPQIQRLGRAQVRMAHELLQRGATPQGRQELAETCGVPLGDVLEMVKCCDLCRMTGMSGKTLERAMALGYDTLEAFRRSMPERVREELAALLEARRERSNRMVDMGSFVQAARRLEDVIEY